MHSANHPAAEVRASPHPFPGWSYTASPCAVVKHSAYQDWNYTSSPAWASSSPSPSQSRSCPIQNLIQTRTNTAA